MQIVFKANSLFNLIKSLNFVPNWCYLAPSPLQMVLLLAIFVVDLIWPLTDNNSKIIQAQYYIMYSDFQTAYINKIAKLIYLENSWQKALEIWNGNR